MSSTREENERRAATRHSRRRRGVQYSDASCELDLRWHSRPSTCRPRARGRRRKGPERCRADATETRADMSLRRCVRLCPRLCARRRPSPARPPRRIWCAGPAAMLPKVANTLIHHTHRAVVAVQNQTGHALRNALQSSSGSSTAVAGWGSPVSGGSSHSGPGPSKFHASGRLQSSHNVSPCFPYTPCNPTKL